MIHVPREYRGSLCSSVWSTPSPRTPHGDSRLVQVTTAWSVKTQRAPSRNCTGARVNGLTDDDHVMTMGTSPRPGLVVGENPTCSVLGDEWVRDHACPIVPLPPHPPCYLWKCPPPEKLEAGVHKEGSTHKVPNPTHKRFFDSDSYTMVCTEKVHAPFSF